MAVLKRAGTNVVATIGVAGFCEVVTRVCGVCGMMNEALVGFCWAVSMVT